MARLPAARYVLLLVPAIIVALDFVFYYLDDFLDEGRSILFLDAYGRGFTTWWIDFQQFWGNFETWTIIGLGVGLFTAFALGKSPGTGDASTWNISRPFVLATSIVIGTALVIGTGNLFSGVPYSVVSILAGSWYPELFPRNVLLLLVVFTGWWLLLGWTAIAKQRRIVYRHAMPGGIVLLGISLLVLHLVLVSNWTPDTINDLLPALLGLIGFLAVVFPLFSFFIALREGQLDRQATGTGKPVNSTSSTISGEQRAREKQTLISIFMMTGIFVAYLLVVNFLRPLNTGIDVKSDFIPKNMITWIYAALLATTTFFAIQGRRGSP